MALDPRQRQKKLERKKAKERKALVKERSRGEIDRFARSAAAPIHECRRSESLWEDGIGYVNVGRKLSNGQIAIASFLLDVFCLGVKDVYCDNVGPIEYEEKVNEHLTRTSPLQKVPPAYARKLVEDSVAYARSFGFEPASDYERACAIFGDIDASACHEQFTFGKNGKPVFMAGPYDSLKKFRRITAQLSQHGSMTHSEGILHFSSANPREEIRRLISDKGDAVQEAKYVE